MIYVYILKLNNSTHYCGITKNIAVRFSQHQQGMSWSTKLYRPVVLVWLHECVDRKSARRLEVKIKNAGVTKWLIKNVGVNPPQLYIPTQEKVLVTADSPRDWMGHTLEPLG